MTLSPHRRAHPIEHMTVPDDPYDRHLIENAHPSGWTNPTPRRRYNLVVVGAGTAGLVSAGGAALLGARVALVERALMGGDCLNVGCVPSKGVIRAARAVDDARQSSAFGVRLSGEPEIDFAAAMRRMRKLRAEISPNDSAARFRDLGVDVYFGDATFVAPDAVEVGGARLEFSRAVIATGARAAELSVPGLRDVGFYTNENIFTLTEMPRRFALVGAGPIGCELAQAFRRFGSLVTVITDGSRIMPREDPDAAGIVLGQMEREGVEFVFGAKVVRAEGRGADKALVISREGREETVPCDAILVGIGRRPNVDGLGLESAGVTYTEQGVRVDDRLRTSNRRIYAAGDVCSPYKFTHAADAMARTVLANALFFGRRRVSDLVIPWCTYTDPEIAHVGMYEDDAREAGFDAGTITQRLEDNDRAVIDGETNGFGRVVYDKKRGKILGGTIVARHAGEMIGELTLAIRTGQKVGALSSTIRPYPTQAEALKQIGDAYTLARLTPRVKRLLRGWFEWRG